MRGFCNGSMLTDIEFPAPHVMLLRRGWKTFTHSDSLAAGQVLHFKLMDATLLSVKVFGRSGARLGCCAESSAYEESSSSSDCNKEDSDGDDDGAKLETVARTRAERQSHRHHQLDTSITIICTWPSPRQSDLPGCWVWMPPPSLAGIWQAPSWTPASSSLLVSLLPRFAGPGSGDQGIA